MMLGNGNRQRSITGVVCGWRRVKRGKLTLWRCCHVRFMTDTVWQPAKRHTHTHSFIGTLPAIAAVLILAFIQLVSKWAYSATPSSSSLFINRNSRFSWFESKNISLSLPVDDAPAAAARATDWNFHPSNRPTYRLCVFLSVTLIFSYTLSLFSCFYHHYYHHHQLLLLLLLPFCWTTTISRCSECAQ